MASQYMARWVEQMEDGNRKRFLTRLLAYGLHEQLIVQLDEIYVSDKIRHDSLDQPVLESLKEIPIHSALRILLKFAAADLRHTSNKSAFLRTLISTYKHRYQYRREPYSAPPDQQRIDEVLKRPGYNLCVTRGQRMVTATQDWSLPTPGPECEVFCSNIPTTIYEDQLIPFFERCGEIHDLRLMMNTQTNHNKGFAFITYNHPDDARRAISELDDQDIGNGSRVKVSKSIANKILFVKNIPLTTDKQKLMTEFGQITDGLVEVTFASPSCKDQTTNRGFCFLNYESHSSASIAKTVLSSNIRICGHTIKVNWARPHVEPQDQPMSKVRVLFVKNLLHECTPAKLAESFSAFGNFDRVTRRKFDYAFVHFKKRQNAIKAMNAMDGMRICGSQIKVSLARYPPNRKKGVEITEEETPEEENVGEVPQVEGRKTPEKFRNWGGDPQAGPSWRREPGENPQPDPSMMARSSGTSGQSGPHTMERFGEFSQPGTSMATGSSWFPQTGSSMATGSSGTSQPGPSTMPGFGMIPHRDSSMATGFGGISEPGPSMGTSFSRYPQRDFSMETGSSGISQPGPSTMAGCGMILQRDSSMATGFGGIPQPGTSMGTSFGRYPQRDSSMAAGPSGISQPGPSTMAGSGMIPQWDTSMATGFGGISEPGPSMGTGFGRYPQRDFSMETGFSGISESGPSMGTGFGRYPQQDPRMATGFGGISQPGPSTMTGSGKVPQRDSSMATGFGGISEPGPSMGTGFGKYPQQDPRMATGFGGISQPGPSMMTGSGKVPQRDSSMVTGFGGISEPGPSMGTGFGGFSQPGPSTMTGSGMIPQRDSSMVTGFGGISEPGPSMGTSFGRYPQQDPRMMTGSGGISEPGPSMATGFGGIPEQGPSMGTGFSRSSQQDPRMATGFGGIPESGPSMGTGFSKFSQQDLRMVIGSGGISEPGPSMGTGFSRYPQRDPSMATGFGGIPESGPSMGTGFSRFPQQDPSMGTDFSRYPQQDPSMMVGFGGIPQPGPSMMTGFGGYLQPDTSTMGVSMSRQVGDRGESTGFHTSRTGIVTEMQSDHSWSGQSSSDKRAGRSLPRRWDRADIRARRRAHLISGGYRVNGRSVRPVLPPRLRRQKNLLRRGGRGAGREIVEADELEPFGHWRG